MKKKNNPGREHNRFNKPYIMETLILADAESPSKNDTNKAVVSRIPQPPILIGKVIENKIIGVNIKNAK